MRGVVLWPAAARVSTFRLHTYRHEKDMQNQPVIDVQNTATSDGEFLVALTVVAGESHHPDVTIKGHVCCNTTVRIGALDVTVAWDGFSFPAERIEVV